MRKYMLLSLIAVAAIFLISCKSNDIKDADSSELQTTNQENANNQDNDNDTQSDYKDIIPTIINKKINTIYSNTIDEKLIVEINYPNIENENDTESFKRINEALDKYAEMSEDSVNWFTEEFKTDANDYPDDLSYKIDYDISLLNKKYLSVSFTSYSFLGGAHPDSVPTAKTYDLQTGEEITLDKIFNISEDEYKDIILDYIYKQTEEKYSDDTEVADSLNDEMLRNFLRPDSFYIKDNNLVIIYYSYDFLCYAVGNQEFYIPLEEIADNLLIDFSE